MASPALFGKLNLVSSATFLPFFCTNFREKDDNFVNYHCAYHLKVVRCNLQYGKA